MLLRVLATAAVFYKDGACSFAIAAVATVAVEVGACGWLKGLIS